MQIRRATPNDLDKLNRLLRQVLEVHHNARPDIFKKDCKKYTDQELINIIKNDDRPIFVAIDNDVVLGYAFCIFQQHKDNNILTDVKTLYIDDLYVDEKIRGKHIGKALYEHVVNFARENGCYNITLNVWAFNEGAINFYKKCGLKERNIYMEEIL